MGELMVADSFVDVDPTLPAVPEPSAAEVDVWRRVLGVAASALGLGRFYSDDQPRDDHGRWGEGGAGGSSDSKGSGGGRDAAAAAAFEKDDVHALADMDWLVSAPLDSGGGRRDEIGSRMAEHLGAAGPPNVASAAEVDRLVGGGALYMVRGLAGDSRVGASTYANEFRSGPPWFAEGTMGSGTYTAFAGGGSSKSHDDVDKIAAGYESSRDGATLRMALGSDAKVVDVRTAEREADAVFNAATAAAGEARTAGDHERADRLDKVASVMIDPGRWALSKGYDAVKSDSKGYMLVVNRSKVTVEG